MSSAINVIEIIQQSTIAIRMNAKMEVINFTACNAELKMANIILTKLLKFNKNYKEECLNGKVWTNNSKT
jgi:hypothetical protein